MAKLVFLGTANAVPDERHENTHMALVGRTHMLLIDCVGNPIVRMQQAGLDVQALTDLVLTHFHPDHVSGVPSLLMSLWLMGRTRQLEIYGLQVTLERVTQVMDLYGWQRWPNFFPVNFHPLPQAENMPVLLNEELRVTASVVQHMIPNIGLRVEFTGGGQSLAYSCDTEPCAQMARLAQNVDVLVHEASGAMVGHSSAAQAGKIANEAQAGALYLIHYPTRTAPHVLVAEAHTQYAGPITLAEDFMTLEF